VTEKAPVFSRKHSVDEDFRDFLIGHKRRFSRFLSIALLISSGLSENSASSAPVAGSMIVRSAFPAHVISAGGSGVADRGIVYTTSLSAFTRW